MGAPASARWIASGAKDDTAKTGEFDRLEVFPREIIFKESGRKRRSSKWSRTGRTARSRTSRSSRGFGRTTESVAEISSTGLFNAKPVATRTSVAFYDNGVAPIPVMLPVGEFVERNSRPFRPSTKVDELIIAKLRKLGIVPSELCSDCRIPPAREPRCGRHSADRPTK
jgi:hypothetical protein